MTKQTFSGSFPPDMRRQLWPLCCGASIISGFKHAGRVTEDELLKEIENQLKQVPDFQVFQGEQLNPRLTFLTLNESQTKDTKLMSAVTKAGFKKFADGRPRGSLQSFFFRDDSNTFTVYPLEEARRSA
jgi:hypothetical protein